MTAKTKELNYNGCKNVLNRVAYKLVKSGKSYKHSDSITINGKKKSYKDIIASIKKNGMNYTNDEYISRLMEDVITKNSSLDFMPSFVIGGGGFNKYNKTSYTKIAKQITSYRNKHNKNPSKFTVNYENFGYLTNEGCKGMGQCNGHNCGPNALQQMFYRLTGILVDESTIAGWASTTSDGTDHAGLNSAVAQFNKKYGATVQIKWYNFSELSWAKLEEMLKKGAIFFHLLYRLKWGHYEPIKSIDDVLKILNSLGDRCSGESYCGYIETRSKATQKSYINGISQKSVAFLYNG